jgi:hypothetical protein
MLSSHLGAGRNEYRIAHVLGERLQILLCSDNIAGRKRIPEVARPSSSCLLFRLIGIAKDFFSNNPFSRLIQIFM